MNNLIHIDYPLDYEKIMVDCKEAEKTAVAYTDDRWPGKSSPGWRISKYTSPYIESIIEDFEVDGRPRFYWLGANLHLPEHVDNTTTCSLNFVLSEDPAPVTVLGENFYYRSASLNTSVLHSVTNGPVERVLFKISIFNESYEDIVKRLKYKK